MRPRERQAPEPAQPGAFMPDGSFNADGQLHQRGHIDGLVRALVHSRRTNRIAPEAAASAIEAANATIAFPNHAQWAICASWYAAWAETAAEEMVKREGRGIGGHWCGERWAAGEQKECGEPRHHDKARPADADRLLERTTAAVKSAPCGDEFSGWEEVR